MRALYLGRFNPPHLGHIHALKYILDQPDIDDVIVLIGSGEKAYSLKNPFTGGERFEMLVALVKEHFDINKFFISAIPDINRNTIWAANVVDLVPPFEVIFTNNPLVQQLFANLSDKEVREIPLINRQELSGKIIRKKMIEDQNWKASIPDVIEPLIEKYKGIDRIQALAKTDEIK